MITVYKLAPYLLMLGMTFIVLDGIWVVNSYDSYPIYPKEAYIYLGIGISLTVMAYVMIQRSRKRSYQAAKANMRNTPEKDNREFIKKLWNQKENIANKLAAILIVVTIFLFILDSGMAFILLQFSIAVGISGFFFLYIMRSDGVSQEELDQEAENDQRRKVWLRRFLRLIDHREHPFSLPLLLFLLVVLTFMLTKEFGLMLSLEVSGNRRYVMSLPSGTVLLTGLIYASGFLYIIQHSDFFGIRQARQSEDMVIMVHFGGVIVGLAVTGIWLFTLIQALLAG